MFYIALDDKGATLIMNSLEQTFTEKLKSLLIFGPNSTRYKDIYDMYIKHLSNARQKWLEIDTNVITNKIINFLKKLL